MMKITSFENQKIIFDIYFVEKLRYHPSQSWPQLNTSYVPKGEIVTLDDLEVYVVGNGRKCILWNYDIFGFNPSASRTRQFCDLFADNGYMVILPDYFRGDSLDFVNEPQS